MRDVSKNIPFAPFSLQYLLPGREVGHWREISGFPLPQDFVPECANQCNYFPFPVYDL
jgi:hypothetical protein